MTMSPLQPTDLAYRPNSSAARVLYSTIPARIGTLSPASSITASRTALRSAMVSARGSPELPSGTKPSTPCESRNLTNARVPLRLTLSSFSNAVMVGEYTPRGEKTSGTIVDNGNLLTPPGSQNTETERDYGLTQFRGFVTYPIEKSVNA